MMIFKDKFLRSSSLAVAVIVAGALLAPVAAEASTLNVMQTEAPRSMDPGDQTATYTAALLDPMYEGLLARAPDLTLKPALATEWKSDDAGLVWTFKLRDGVT
ncbi:MAG: glycosyl transferase, partial [Rhizobiaceae bacterium]|nr:glycosyl transferase [Rhizobiaceae bacterium]